ncbi:MAG: hypothetical protein ACRYFX_17505 [Janthinobacterium lividum]
MKGFVVFVLSLLFSVSDQAQVIQNCESLKADTSTCAKVLASAFKTRKGELIYKNVSLEICSQGGYFIIAFGISERYQKAGILLDCEDVFAGRPFNNRKNGLKHGVWFKGSLFGRVRRVTQYDSGQIRFIITFWPDGLPKYIIKFNTSGKPVPDSGKFYGKAVK